jgi:hypothetical protein
MLEDFHSVTLITAVNTGHDQCCQIAVYTAILLKHAKIQEFDGKCVSFSILELNCLTGKESLPIA